jgi:cell division septum initiation protein DivIVA
MTTDVEREKLQAEIERLEGELAKVTQQRDELAGAFIDQQARIAELEAEVKSLLPHCTREAKHI